MKHLYISSSKVMSPKMRYLADTALKNRLFVSGWLMNIYLKHIRDDDDQVPICVAFYKSKAVGTITLTPWGDFSIFVKKSMRRKGIGTALIRQMKRLDRNATGHSLGSVAGQKFFKSIGVV